MDILGYRNVTIDGMPRTFTQDEVNRMTGEARRAAANELATDLGCTVAEAKAIIEAKSTADEASKSEAQRLLDEAKASQAEAASASAAAKRDRLDAKVERALGAVGVTAVDRAVRMLDLPDDADDALIASEIEALKADVPALFTTGPATPPKPGITPPNKPRGNGTGKSFEDRGREALKAAGIRIPDTAA